MWLLPPELLRERLRNSWDAHAREREAWAPLGECAEADVPRLRIRLIMGRVRFYQDQTAFYVPAAELEAARATFEPEIAMSPLRPNPHPNQEPPESKPVWVRLAWCANEDERIHLRHLLWNNEIPHKVIGSLEVLVQEPHLSQARPLLRTVRVATPSLPRAWVVRHPRGKGSPT